ncbi:MAG TPA: shikimate kinase [Syntrophorhabdaceae bacterium]|nr:shikimate kinase [Syntrophorhabdaceae bacterium]HPU30363.1 shikimate kinase [Syntrophorhabdaceae bacterium]
MSEKKAIFAVAGNPVLHSLSPVLFNSVFLSKKMDAVYTRILAYKAEEVIELIKQINIKGVNVTSPFKDEVLKHIHIVHGDAKRIGAVNTIINVDNILHGYNTDINGIEGVLAKNQLHVSHKKAMVIGAGGAARAACFVLKKKGAHVTVINRTYKKAVDIAKDLGLKVIPLEDLNEKVLDADIFVQCLPRDIYLVNPKHIKKNAFVLDANYSIDSLIVKGAEERGYCACDGRDWLLYQAEASFKIFTGQFSPPHIMEKALTEKPLDVNKRRNISLIGFMGSGKSIVGRHLSSLTGFEFLDMDSMIEKIVGMSVNEIFKRKGEKFFRDIEEKEIEKAGKLTKKVISCGGGAVISKKNRDVLRKNSTVIWLWARPETIFKRIVYDKTRPLIDGIDSIESLRTMVDKRIFLYGDVADIILYTENKSSHEIARMIYGEINKSIGD